MVVVAADVPEAEEGDEAGGGGEPAEEGEGAVQVAKKLLAELEASREENGGRSGDDLVARLVREKLLSKPCQNQGFVLDGAPTSYNMAKELFAPVEDEEEQEEEEEMTKDDEELDEDVPPVDKKLIPGKFNSKK